MKPNLSIIIPCYNSENTLEETLISVLNQEYEFWEAIIVNDGSPDNVEAIALKWIDKDTRFKYFKKENGGLGTARNFGIAKAEGIYILPLDSDNKIRPKFAGKAIEVLTHNPDVGVVYGDAQYFGEKEGVWKVGSFDKFRMLEHNYIDACTIIRKHLFDEIGDYDTAMPYQGHEDWEFWLRILETNYSFYYLEEICFDYRVTSDSMIRTFDDKMMNENINYVLRKHAPLYHKSLGELYMKHKSLLEAVEKSRLLKLGRMLRGKK